MKINQVIERESPIPIYHQVFLILKELIDSNELKEGDIIPSERDLCDMLNVSRITIRKALEKLESSGYIKKEHGKQTEVTKRFNPLVWTNMNDFSRDMISKGVPVKSIILDYGYIKPDQKILEILNPSHGDKVFCLKRIRTSDGDRLNLSISYLIDKDGAFGNANIDEDISIKDIWKKNDFDADYCDETIQARIPTKEIVNLLELDSKTAILQRDRITYDSNGKVIEYVVQYLNANYFKYYIEKGKAL